MASATEELKAWPKAKEGLTKALEAIIELGDQETREDQAQLHRLRQENDRLNLQLTTALKDLRTRKADARVIPASDDESSEPGSPLNGSTSPPPKDGLQQNPRRSTTASYGRISTDSPRDRIVQDLPEEEFPDRIPSDWSDKEAVERYNRLVPKFKELLQKHETLRAESTNIHQHGNETRYSQHDSNEFQILQHKYSKLETYCKNLKKNHESLSRVRSHMEDELRKKKKSIEGWIKYTNHLDMKNKKLTAKLEGHAIVSKKSLSPGLPMRTGHGKPPTTSEYMESEDEMPLRPLSDILTSPFAPSKAASPISPVFTSRLERSRHSSLTLPENPKSSGEASRNLRGGLRAESDNILGHDRPCSSPRVQTDPLRLQMQSIVSRSQNYPGDGNLTVDDQSLLKFDEAEPELPKLDNGNGNADTHETPHTSSTQGEPDPTQIPLIPEAPVVEQRGSSPLVVCERVVRRPKRKRKIAGNTEEVHIKIENITSSPISPANLSFEESMDLDDHPYMMTPRKKPTARPVSHEDSELGILVHRDGSGAATRNEVPLSPTILVERSPDKVSGSKYLGKPDISSALQPLNTNKQLQRQDDQPPQKRRRRNAVIVSSNYASIIADRENDEDQARINTEQKALEPPLQKSTPRNRLFTSDILLKSANQHHGRTSSPSSKCGSRPTSSSDAMPGTRSSKLQSTPKRGSPRNVEMPKTSSLGEACELPSKPPQPEGRPTSVKLSKYSNKPTPPSRNEKSGNVESGPLRYRPLESLRLDSFKINPKYMPGYDHAYHDVVRKQAERKCIPGCERACCGPRFRRLAESMLATRIAGHVSAATRRSDEQALQAYMGDDFLKYARLGATHQRDLLVRALARRMATEHGSHKNVHERMLSPPGFWDMDFPATQEMLANRERAGREERRVVEERYRDAVRPGGRYVFRDE